MNLVSGRIEGPPILQSGGARGDRTLNLYDAIVALFQLSYDPEKWLPDFRTLGDVRPSG